MIPVFNDEELLKLDVTNNCSNTFSSRRTMPSNAASTVDAAAAEPAAEVAMVLSNSSETGVTTAVMTLILAEEEAIVRWLEVLVLGFGFWFLVWCQKNELGRVGTYVV